MFFYWSSKTVANHMNGLIGFMINVVYNALITGQSIVNHGRITGITNNNGQSIDTWYNVGKPMISTYHLGMVYSKDRHGDFGDGLFLGLPHSVFVQYICIHKYVDCVDLYHTCLLCTYWGYLLDIQLLGSMHGGRNCTHTKRHKSRGKACSCSQNVDMFGWDICLLAMYNERI